MHLGHLNRAVKYIRDVRENIQEIVVFCFQLFKLHGGDEMIISNFLKIIWLLLLLASHAFG